MRERSLWTLHIAAGLAVLVLLGLHMAVMHLTAVLGLSSMNPAGHDPLAWENVVHRGQQILITLSYLLLLGVALYHGLYGLRNILFELTASAEYRRFLSIALLVVGVGMFVLGSWAALAARATALAAGS